MHTKFEALEQNGIWTVFQGDVPIGRAMTKNDADNFVYALNVVLGTDLRDRLLSAINDAVEGCFDG